MRKLTPEFKKLLARAVDKGLFAFNIPYGEFLSFYRQGKEAVAIYFYYKVFQGLQLRDRRYLPVKDEPHWVQVTNALLPIDRSNKSEIIKKLKKANLIVVRKPKTKSKRLAPIIRLKKPQQRVGIKSPRSGKRWEFGHGAMKQAKQTMKNGPRPEGEFKFKTRSKDDVK